ncbi:hypothetical protein J6590_088921 [Homalodisca vitripennis]|nr:hypothetical protein J6590_088921 [Homalodisca vitripennis]
MFSLFPGGRRLVQILRLYTPTLYPINTSGGSSGYIRGRDVYKDAIIVTHTERCLDGEEEVWNVGTRRYERSLASLPTVTMTWA